MKKLLILSLISSFLFWAVSIVSADESCKEEVIVWASNPVFSSDWIHSAYVLKSDDWEYMIIKDWNKIWEGNGYQNIELLNYSIDWKSYAYYLYKSDWNQVIVKDWVELWAWIDFKYASNWDNYVYIGFTDWKQFIVKDWVKFKEFDGIIWNPYIYFSSDFEKIWYIWLIWDKSYIVENWDIIWEWDMIITNGEEYTYEYNDNWVNNIVKNWINLGSGFAPLYSPDWKWFSYVRNIDWEHYVIKDWVNLWEWYSQVYSPDWKKFAFISVKDWKLFLNNNWEESLIDYYTAHSLLYSPNWDKLSYIVSDNDLKYLHLINDWKEIAKAKQINNIQYSSDWKHISYEWLLDDWNYHIFLDTEDLWIGYNLVYSLNWQSNIYIDSSYWSKVIKDWIYLWQWYNPTYLSNQDSFAFDLYDDLKKWIYINKCILNTSVWQNNYNILDDSINNKSNKYTKKLILSKSKLVKTTKWKKYIEKIDNVLLNLSNDKLEKLYDRVARINKRWKYKDYYDYLEAKIWLKLLK